MRTYSFRLKFCVSWIFLYLCLYSLTDINITHTNGSGNIICFVMGRSTIGEAGAGLQIRRLYKGENHSLESFWTVWVRWTSSNKSRHSTINGDVCCTWLCQCCSIFTYCPKNMSDSKTFSLSVLLISYLYSNFGCYILDKVRENNETNWDLMFDVFVTTFRWLHLTEVSPDRQGWSAEVKVRIVKLQELPFH